MIGLAVLLRKRFKSFVDVPPMVFSPADYCHLLILLLTHVPYPAIARESIEGKARGLPQAYGADLPAQVRILTTRMRIVRGIP